MFNGLRFDADNPYTYREGKRLIRLMGDELQARKELMRTLGVDPSGERRPAITSGPGVWDFLPLAIAKGANFVRHPYLTMALHETYATASLTIPNGMAGRFRTKLKASGVENFLQVLRTIELQLQPISNQSDGARPFVYALQRRYHTQRSIPTVDGEIRFDLRTCVPSTSSDVKYQPEWAEGLFWVLVRKKSNIQFGVQMRFDYACEKVRSPAVLDLFVESWIAMKPLLVLALDEIIPPRL